MLLLLLIIGVQNVRDGKQCRKHQLAGENGGALMKWWTKTDRGETVDPLPAEEALNYRLAYEQLCVSYRAIDDFRAKLLGFLPLVTGGSLGLLFSGRADLATELFLPAGLFGILVTFGLFTYEIFGIKKCHALIRDGKRLETRLRLAGGQFTERPDDILGLINEPFAAALIYPAVLAAWAYLALSGLNPAVGVRLAVTVFLAGLVCTLLFDWRLKKVGSTGQAENGG
jgi:hypothetical protein